MTESDEAPSRRLWVRIGDPDGRVRLEAERLGVPVAVYVRRAVARWHWLRDVQARGGRVLVENAAGLLREVRYPEGLR